MKNSSKTLIILLMFFAIQTQTFSVTNIEKLNEIEKSYYGYTYKNEKITSRLARLEKEIYGQQSVKSENERVNKLYNDMGFVITGGSAPIAQNTPAEANIGPKADAGIKYPVVDTIEEKTFQKSFPNDEIYSRIARLEKQVFKKESTGSLNERVDALRSKVLGGTQTAAADIDPSTEEIVLENGETYYGNGYDETDSHYNYYSYENSKNHIPEIQSHTVDNRISDSSYSQNYDLDILEKSLFGKKYPNETSSQRLARLESQVFHRTFTDNEEARIQRLLAVTTAQKTSQEYDSNKWARRLNTGIQIGSILLMVLAMIL